MLPLRSVCVVNLGDGLAPALVGKFLHEMGAHVLRAPPPGNDPFPRLYPAYESLQHGVQLDIEAGRSAAALETLLKSADVCIIGGEDHPLLERVRHVPETVAAVNSRLIVLHIAGYPRDSAQADRPAVDVLVQARSGLVYEHYTHRPNLMAFQPSHYGAALQGLIGLLAALYARESDRCGQIVSTSMYEGALAWVNEWGKAEYPNEAFNLLPPKDPCPLILQCVGGDYIHVVLGSSGSKARLYEILGVDEPGIDPKDAGLPDASSGARKFFGDVDLLSSYATRWKRGDLLDALRKAGVAAAAIQSPGKCWGDAQVLHNRLLTSSANGVRCVGNPVITFGSPASARPTAPGSAQPLDGVRIVDFGTYVAGPFCSVHLRALGADVIKVEPAGGEPIRKLLRGYIAVNRGKRSIAVNLKTPQGGEIIRRLCARADVVTSNFRAGAAARLGIDASTLHRMRPEMVVLESSAFGKTGPNAEQSAFDLTMQAHCGHEFRAGGVGNPPLWNRATMIDYANGYLGAIAVLAALYHRARTGEGADLDMPLLNAGIYLLSELVQLGDGTFVGAPALNKEQTGFHPAESLYATADGWIAVAIRDDTAARRFLKILELDGTLGGDLARWGDAEAGVIANACRSWRCDELLTTLAAGGVWAEKCRAGEEAVTLADPELISRNTVRRCAHPQLGIVTGIGVLFSFSRSAVADARPAPLAGEHTREVLSELGYQSDEIESLISNGVATETK